MRARDPRLAIPVALAVAVTLALSLASHANAFVYWADRYDAIGRANLDGLGADPSFVNPIPIASGIYTPESIAIDGAHVYWGANLINSMGQEEWVIGRSNLDGSGVDPSFITGALFPSGVIVNNEHIYWVNDAIGAGSSTIGRANLDASGVNQSFITGLGHPCGLAIDGAHLFWANGNAIGRANVDGTGVDESFITLNPLDGPASTCGVAVDSNHIYWADTNYGLIGRANLDGTGIEESFISGANGPCGVTVDNAHVYWATDGGTGVIGQANLDGSGVNQSFITDSGGFMCGVAVDALTPTTTTISTPESSIVYGQDATFTATVLNTPSSSPIMPTGTVQFKVNGIDDGSAVALDNAGQAEYAPTFPLDVGDIVTAEYTGNAQLGASTSPGSELSVHPANTVTALTASPNPQTSTGEVAFVATVTNSSSEIVPFGSVQFLIDGEPALEELLLNENGQAGVGVSELHPGDYTVQAVYHDGLTLNPDFTDSQASLTEHITTLPPAPAKAAASSPTLLPPFQATLNVFPLGPTIHNLLRDRFSDSLALTGAGSVSEELFSDNGVLPATASRASAARHKQSKHPRAALLLATGSASITTAGTVTVTLLPTAAGKKTLKKTRHSLRVVLITSVKDAKTGELTNLPPHTLTLKH